MGERGWDFFRKEGRVGTGDWDAFPPARMPEIQAAARTWAKALAGVERPWLCWSVDPDWCLVQQQLVRAVGWTPVVGTDGTTAPPRVLPESVYVDFNRELRLPGMWMHFVLEFVYLFAPRMAFWHSDVLTPLSVTQAIADQYERTPDGHMVAAPKHLSVLYALRRLARGKRVLGVSGWTEVAGFTTRGASQSQFDHGCGWWRTLQVHPNASPEVMAQKPHWEHAVGIRHWERLFHGPVSELCIDIGPHHYSRAGQAVRRYKRIMSGGQQYGSKAAELNQNFDLASIVTTLGMPIDLSAGRPSA